MALFGVRMGGAGRERPGPPVATVALAERSPAESPAVPRRQATTVVGPATVTRVSVVIANYNYGRFLAAAIDSALALEWPDVEVVVVDDGSVDESRDVLDAYRDRVTVILQENAGQRVACNTGYAATTGEAVVFLDADDELEPQAARRIAEVWSPTVSKVQFPLNRIDASGKSLGSSFPSYRVAPTADQMRRWLLVTSDYPTPPGSGNAYSRAFLERIMPVTGADADAAADSALLAAAPFLGDVITITEPLGRYRLHGANDSNLKVDDSRFAREVVRSRRRWEYALGFLPNDAPVVDGHRTIRRSRSLLQLRVAAARVSPGGSPLPGDNRTVLLADAVRSLFGSGYQSLRRRPLIAAWCVAVLLAPSPTARRLVMSRFSRGGES